MENNLYKNITPEFVEKVYKMIKNNMLLDEFISKMGCSYEETIGILEILRISGKKVDVEMNDENKIIIRKQTIRQSKIKLKPSMDELNKKEICIVSDTHLGNNKQQLHLLNEIYKEAANREIDTVLHVGDLVDGDYLAIRKEQGRQMFLRGFNEQASYVVDMYPKVNGITTKFILGSHDETHYKNGGATLDFLIPKCRPDMEYLGQDSAIIDINNVKIKLDHPGGGCAKSLSYKLQSRIEQLESGQKPKILLVGHYHKSYYFSYRNVHGILVPCLCDKTQFQEKQGLSNIVGAYFLTIYSDQKGNIQFITPEEILFGADKMWDEAGKDQHKVKQLVM